MATASPEAGALVVDFLGTGGSAPTAARASLALRVELEGGALLVDCGEGCARQLLIAGHEPEGIDACLITHLHADHYLGLGGLFALCAERGRRAPLRIVGPRGTEAVVRALARACGPLPFELELTTLGGGRALNLGYVQARAFAVSHVGPRLRVRVLPGPESRSRRQRRHEALRHDPGARSGSASAVATSAADLYRRSASTSRAGWARFSVSDDRRSSLYTGHLDTDGGGGPWRRTTAFYWIRCSSRV